MDNGAGIHVASSGGGGRGGAFDCGEEVNIEERRAQAIARNASMLKDLQIYKPLLPIKGLKYAEISAQFLEHCYTIQDTEPNEKISAAHLEKTFLKWMSRHADFTQYESWEHEKVLYIAKSSIYKILKDPKRSFWKGLTFTRNVEGNGQARQTMDKL